jgi:hypothetical protein
MFVRRLEDEAEGKSALQISKEAAAEVVGAVHQGLANNRLLRLFQAGDARTKAAACILAEAAREWNGAGGKAWGYTHAWRDVPRDAWAGVSMLASVETPADGREALKAGWAPARVTRKLPEDGRAIVANGVRWIPCPEQTRGVACVRCGLCMDADGLHARKAGILFEAHGSRAEKLKRRLPMMRGAS